MFDFVNEILIVNDKDRVCFFDPNNLFIFSKKADVSIQEAINNYKVHIKKILPSRTNKSINLKNVPTVNLELHITDNCNLRCRYCYLRNNYLLKNKNMSEKTITKAFDFVLQNFPKVKSVQISLFGGEPAFFFKKFEYLLNIAKQKFKEKKVFFTFATNGTVLNKEIISFIKQKEVSFCLSMDGGQKIQDYLRPTLDGSGSFKIIEKNLPILKKINTSLMARVTITPYNIKLSDLFEHLKAKGFKKINFVLCSSDEFQINQKIFENELEKFSEVYSKHIIEAEEIIDVLMFSTFLRKLHIGEKRYNHCNNGKNIFAVSIDEKIYSCHRFVGNDKFQIGDLNTGFNEQSSIRKKLLKFNVAKEAKCKNCFAKYICAGGCTHEKHILSSKISCEITRLLLYLSIKIYFRLLNYPKAIKKLEALFKIKNQK